LKLHMVSLSLLVLCLTLAAVPAMAQVLYSNGDTNGAFDALTINFGYAVSDSFPVLSASATVTGAEFAMWLIEGDTLETADLSITSGENGGTSYFNQVLNFTQSACSLNQYSYDICTESASFSATFNSGTYWLNLQNAVTAEGNPVYWDENEGPSSASQSQVGTLPSESFTVLGTTSGTTSTSTSTTGTSVPEPSSIMLFGSGILGLASVVRRKFF